MKSEEVLILPIIIGRGSPPFQVKVTTLKTEAAGPLYLILNQQARRAGMCILGLNCVSLYHFKSTFEFNDVAKTRPAQGKDKSNSVYRHTELGLVREVKRGSES